MPLIRAVLFDFGLVLSGPPDPVAWHRMELVFNSSNDALHSAYWRHRHDYDLGVLNGVSFWRTVGVELGHPLNDQELAQLLQADVDLWTQPNQPMIDWAATLQDAGIATGILSNMGDAMETGIIARFPWMAQFQHSTFSHNLRVAKPDEQIYRHAIAAAGEPAGAILFIDDRIENVEAASALGIRAIQYTSHENFVRQFHEANFTGLPVPTAPIASSTP